MRTKDIIIMCVQTVVLLDGDLYEEIHLNLISCFIYVCGILAVVFMTNIYLGIFFIVYGIVLIIVSLNISKPLFDMQKMLW